MRGKIEVLGAGALWTCRFTRDPLSPRKPAQTHAVPVPDLPKTRTRANGYGICTGRVWVGPRIPAGLPVVFPNWTRPLPLDLERCLWCVSPDHCHLWTVAKLGGRKFSCTTD